MVAAQQFVIIILVVMFVLAMMGIRYKPMEHSAGVGIVKLLNIICG